MKLTASTWRQRLAERPLTEGDEVVFHVLFRGVRERLYYKVSDNYLNRAGGQNGIIFTYLEISKVEFAALHYGYHRSSADDFPSFNHGDYEALGRIVRALFLAVETHNAESNNTPPPPPPPLPVWDSSNGKYCVACRKYENPQGRLVTRDGKTEMCSDCYTARTGHGIECSICNGRFVGADIVSIDEATNKTVCRHCHDYEGDRRIHSYNHKPQARFFSDSYIGQKEYLGWELEVEAPDVDISEISNAFRDKRWYFKMDGSLEDGVEVVSHPMSFAYNRKHKADIDTLLQGLKDNSCKSGSTVTCGMHIHVSKDAISSIQLWKMLDFFRKNKPFIYQMSGRTVRKQLDRYASLGGINKRTQPRMAKKYWDMANKYTAINIRPNHTIEFRIFKGTLNSSKFFKNLEFVDSLVQWTKNESLERITIANYCEYVKENKKVYPNVLRYMTKNNMLKRKLVRKSKELIIEM